MRLVSCYIENFGALHDFHYDFTEGLNVIYKENGWGKSTLAAFIRVMLYGFSNETKRGTLENERRRYAPWQQGVYGGEIIFEAKGRRVSLRKVFGNKANLDQVMITDADTRLPITEYGDNPGEDLFLIDDDSFKRTVLISQNDCKTFTTDKIHAKLGNLAENTDDMNNFETADKSLKDLLNRMDPVKKTGSIAKQKSEMSTLRNIINSGDGLEDAIGILQDKKMQCISEKDELLKKIARLNRMQSEISTYKDGEVQKNQYENLCDTMNKRQEKLAELKRYFPKEVPSMESIDEVGRLLREAEGSKLALEALAISEEDKEVYEGFLKMHNGKKPGQVYDNVFWRELEEQLLLAEEYEELNIQNLEEGLSLGEKKQLTLYEEEFEAGVPTAEEVDAVKQQLRTYELEMAKKQNLEFTLSALEMVDRKTKQQGKKPLWILAFAGVLLLAVGLGICFLWSILGGTLCAVMGVCITVAGFVCSKEKVEPEDEQMIQTREQLVKLEKDMEQIQEEIQGFWEKYGLKTNGEPMLYELSALQDKVKEYGKLKERFKESEKHNLSGRIKWISLTLKEYLAREDIVKLWQGFEEAIRESDSFQKKLRYIQKKAGEACQCEKRCEKYFIAENTWKRAEHKVISSIENMGFEPMWNLTEQLQNIVKQVHLYSNEYEQWQEAQKEKEQFEQTHEMEKILALQNPGEEESLEALAGKLEETGDRVNELTGMLQNYEQQIYDLEEHYDEWNEAVGDYETLKEKTESDLQKYELLKKTKLLLEQAKSSFTAKYTTPLMEHFQKYYEMLSGCECTKINMDADIHLSVLDYNMPREVEALSAGNQDLIGICFRMALVDAMYEAEKPFLIMDDPFVNLDVQKTSRGSRFMETLGEKYQIIYFTCHESRKI